MIHKTTVGVDSARLLIVDPLYLGLIDWPDKLANLPKIDPLTGFVKVGPARSRSAEKGILVGTGLGDGTYTVEIETSEQPASYGRVARVTVTFIAGAVERGADEQ